MPVGVRQFSAFYLENGSLEIHVAVVRDQERHTEYCIFADSASNESLFSFCVPRTEKQPDDSMKGQLSTVS